MRFSAPATDELREMTVWLYVVPLLHYCLSLWYVFKNSLWYIFFLLDSFRIPSVRLIDLCAVSRQFSADDLGSSGMLSFCFSFPILFYFLFKLYFISCHCLIIFPVSIGWVWVLKFWSSPNLKRFVSQKRSHFFVYCLLQIFNKCRTHWWFLENHSILLTLEGSQDSRLCYSVSNFQATKWLHTIS